MLIFLASSLIPEIIGAFGDTSILKYGKELRSKQLEKSILHRGGGVKLHQQVANDTAELFLFESPDDSSFQNKVVLLF